MIKLKGVSKRTLLGVACLVLILVSCLFIGNFFFEESAKTSQATYQIPAKTSQVTSPILAKTNKVLFFFCVIGGWLIITFNNINTEAVNVFLARKKWEETTGGEKPMINWSRIAIRSFLLLIMGVLIIYVVPEIAVKIQKLLT